MPVLHKVMSKESEINQGLLGCNIRVAQRIDNDKIGISCSLQAAALMDSSFGTFCKHHVTKYVKRTDKTINLHRIKKENGPCKLTPTVK